MKETSASPNVKHVGRGWHKKSCDPQNKPKPIMFGPQKGSFDYFPAIRDLRSVLLKLFSMAQAWPQQNIILDYHAIIDHNISV